MALKGELTDIPINEVFSLIRNVKSTGLLKISRKGKELVVHFLEGEVINAEGDTDPVSSLEYILGLREGSFEFDKGQDVTKAKDTNALKTTLNNAPKIQSEWEALRKAFNSENTILQLSETNKEEIELSGKEWKIIAILKSPKTIAQISKEAQIGIFELMKILHSMLKKDLIAVVGEEESFKAEEGEEIADMVPVRNLGYWAMRSPIEGIKAIEFYRRIDDKKTVGQIAKEMGISLKEAKEIVDYLEKNDKIEKVQKKK